MPASASPPITGRAIPRWRAWRRITAPVVRSVASIRTCARAARWMRSRYGPASAPPGGVDLPPRQPGGEEHRAAASLAERPRQADDDGVASTPAGAEQECRRYDYGRRGQPAGTTGDGTALQGDWVTGVESRVMVGPQASQAQVACFDGVRVYSS